MKTFRFLSLLFVLSLIGCCNAPEKETNKAPDAITLSVPSMESGATGGVFVVEITAPSIPKLVGLPDWVSKKEGEYSNYNRTVTFTLSPNLSFDERSAQIKIVSSGVSSVFLPIRQKGRAGDPELAKAQSSRMGLGWNLGNHFDAYSGDMPSETCWGGIPATQATFSKLKEYGFSTVRIPVTWLGKIGPAPDYLIDKEWIDRVYEVVGFAEKAGLNVIVNTHHDEDHGDGHWLNLKNAVDSELSNQQIKQEIVAVWTQIANKFKDKGDFLIMESFNELIYGDEWTSSSNTEKKCNVINQWNQVFVDAVRATGGNNATRWLGVPTYAASPNYTEFMLIPADPSNRTMLSIHCYDPYEYTIGPSQHSDWGHTGTASNGAHATDEQAIRNTLEKLTTYAEHGIPCYLGEFGCSLRNPADARAWAFYKYYMEYFVKAAKTYGLPCFLWDNGAPGYGQEHHAYINHGTGEFIGSSGEIIETIVKAWNTADASYTLQSVYDSAPKF